MKVVLIFLEIVNLVTVKVDYEACTIITGQDTSISYVLTNNNYAFITPHKYNPTLTLFLSRTKIQHHIKSCNSMKSIDQYFIKQNAHTNFHSLSPGQSQGTNVICMVVVRSINFHSSIKNLRPGRADLPTLISP